jgi:outer membrane receptor protein involved in Fe transport
MSVLARSPESSSPRATSRQRLPLFAIAAGLATSLAAQSPSPARTADLSPVVVTATRAQQAASSLPITVDVFSREDFAASPALAIDDVLKSSAAFSLFRRAHSLMAHPTSQGVSLRNLGPSGAGRTLVLLDGVPLNDPFGGWVAWTKLPRLNLAGAEIVRGGNSSAWGSTTLGGTVQLLTEPVPGDDLAGTSPQTKHAQVQAELGDFRTRSAEILARHGAGRHTLDVSARAFATEGFWRVGANDRGAIDRRTDSDHQLVQLGWSYATDSLQGGVTARHFREDRGNGTPFQRNASEETFVSGRLGGALSNRLRWNAHAYFQTQDFSSGFSAISADRATETPSLDQYSVPADAAGAAITGTWRSGDSATTTFGADARWVRGETREAFFLQNGEFTRRRWAGGEQTFAGVFVQHDRTLAPGWRVQLGARGDYWRNHIGHRRELDQTSGATLRDETFAPREGGEFSPGLGLVWQTTEWLRWRGAAYRAFRVPTLNELYRPFRVGNVITEANPALDVETLEGAELGANLALGRFRFAVTGFVNELHDAVANVTLGVGPATIPGIGFVPAGGAGRQRRNLDEVRVRGIELSARWQATSALVFRGDYLFSDATVTRAAPPATGLAGLRLAQVPRHTVTAGGDWQPHDRWRLRAQLRHVSSAYEDDANTLRLAPATTWDVRAAYALGRNRAGELFVAVENAFAESVETGRDANGRVDYGLPRYVHGGITWAW